MTKLFLFAAAAFLIFLSSASTFAETLSEASCITFEQFKKLPGKTTVETVRIPIPEAPKIFHSIATRIKKHTVQFEAAFLVFDLNGGQIPLFQKIIRDNKVFQFVFDENGVCVPAYSNNVGYNFIYSDVADKGPLYISGIDFYFEALGADKKPYLVFRQFFLKKRIVIKDSLVSYDYDFLRKGRRK